MPQQGVPAVTVPAELRSAPHKALEVSFQHLLRRQWASVGTLSKICIIGDSNIFFLNPPAKTLSSPSRLQDYVHERVIQFSPVFASRIAPGTALEQVQKAATDVLSSLPPPDYTGALASRDLQLVFRHDCQ